MTATIKYDFDMNMWKAELDDESSRLVGYGETPDEAINSLMFDANKHGLWPDGVVRRRP